MREVAKGDLILHFLKTTSEGRLGRYLAGYSRATDRARVSKERPPTLGDWDKHESFYVIDLHDFVQFDHPLDLNWFAKAREAEIAAQLASGAKNQPYAPYGASVRVVTGLYLRKCSSGLYELLRRHEPRLPALEADMPQPEAERPTSDPEELADRIARIQKSGKIPKPEGQEAPTKRNRTSDAYDRDPNVIAWVLEQARGNCEGCQQPAPFKKANGAPFLEVHHLRRLADGGPDIVENVIALCPNCHRRLHYGEDAEDVRGRIYASIPRLVRPYEPS